MRLRKSQSGPNLPLFYRTLVALYVLLIVIFSYQAGLTILAKISGVLLSLSYIYYAVSKGATITFPVSYKLWLAWFFFALISGLQARDVSLAIFKAITLIQVVPLAFVVSSFIVWNRSSEFYWRVLVFAGVVATLLVLTNPTAFTGIDGRVYGTLGNANAFGGLLAIGFFICLIWAVSGSRWFLRAAVVAVAALFFYMATQTGSRQAILGCFAGAAAVAVLYARRIQVRNEPGGILIIGMMVVGLVGAAIYVTTTDFWFRMETAFVAAETGSTMGADSSLQGRLALYGYAFETAVKNPVFGVGLDNMRTVGAGTGLTIGTYAHSTYMEILATTGFVGFFLYFSIYYFWLRDAWRTRSLLYKRDWFAPMCRIGAIIFVVLAFDFATVSYYQKFDWLIFAGVIAELELANRERRRLRREKHKAARADQNSLAQHSDAKRA